MLAFSLLVAALALAVHAALNNGSQPNVCMSMMCRAPLIALQILIFFVDDLGYGLYAATYISDERSNGDNTRNQGTLAATDTRSSRHRMWTSWRLAGCASRSGTLAPISARPVAQL